MTTAWSILKKIFYKIKNWAKALQNKLILFVLELRHRLMKSAHGTYFKNDERLKLHHTFSTSKSKKRMSFYPVKLDVKQTEVFSTLFVDNKQSELIWDPWKDSIPVFNIVATDLESDFCRNKPKLSIFLDLHDSPNRNNQFLINTKIISAIKNLNLEVILLKLQFDEFRKYPFRNPLPKQIHVLSMPMLLGGSRFHITLQKDFQGDRLFRKNIVFGETIKHYFDWSWIGGITSPDRIEILEKLEHFQKYSRFFSITKPGHPDANVATVPFEEYINISRQSKVCLSLNGAGLWCLKDAELFSNNCFILRQNHSNLNLNPLSPKDGSHWVLFKNEDALDKLEYYILNEKERNKIRINGFNYFREGLVEKKWAQYYLSFFLGYLREGKKEAWEKLCVG